MLGGVRQHEGSCLEEGSCAAGCHRGSAACVGCGLNARNGEGKVTGQLAGQPPNLRLVSALTSAGLPPSWPWRSLPSSSGLAVSILYAWSCLVARGCCCGCNRPEHCHCRGRDALCRAATQPYCSFSLALTSGLPAHPSPFPPPSMTTLPVVSIRWFAVPQAVHGCAAPATGAWVCCAPLPSH